MQVDCNDILAKILMKIIMKIECYFLMILYDYIYDKLCLEPNR